MSGGFLKSILNQQWNWIDKTPDRDIIHSMRSIFGWSYPPGCNSVPGDEPEVQQPHCRKCGKFLSWKSTRSEPWEASTQCDGEVGIDGLAACGYAGQNHAPHKVIWDAGEHYFHRCNSCGTETKL